MFGTYGFSRGIAPNLGKVVAVKEFKVPTNVKRVREFLGLAGHYKIFVANFSKTIKDQ